MPLVGISVYLPMSTLHALPIIWAHTHTFHPRRSQYLVFPLCKHSNRMRVHGTPGKEQSSNCTDVYAKPPPQSTVNCTLQRRPQKYSDTLNVRCVDGRWIEMNFGRLLAVIAMFRVWQMASHQGGLGRGGLSSHDRIMCAQTHTHTLTTFSHMVWLHRARVLSSLAVRLKRVSSGTK